ncbi:hypothetical protein RHMOL_Rhmol04G0105100 [Rhododendron molle]|uniref:Uncharacterized protein n=1 Tax=Rhododendron molle TaxID=49168 RepID=A0ACC0NZB4_RHOML|nr:hypothetical protein RHMOL_Rhmol04G0105100 [Rhododendron molle]
MAVAVAEESSIFITDDAYEFSAPRFFDFISKESENDKRRSEIWFDSSLSCAPSPFLPKIETTRSVLVESLLDLGEAEQSCKVYAEEKTCGEAKEVACTHENASTIGGACSCSVKFEPVTAKDKKSVIHEVCTPKMIPRKGDLLQTYSKNNRTVKKTASTVRNPSSLKSQIQPQYSHGKNTRPTSVRRETNLEKIGGTPNFALENQPIKRQKLEGGQSREASILSIKTQNLPHKTRPGLISSTSNLGSSTAKTRKNDRKVYVREPAAPFISMAEMMQKFESNTRERYLPCKSSSLKHDGTASKSHRKPKLTLTRPKEPELKTSQRVRSVRIKSFAELEEETKAKIPKLRPISNKKILEAPTLPVPPRSTPHPPEFQELHLGTMERANQNAETATVASTESAPRHHQWIPHLTAPKAPLLQTCLRAHPPRIKSSVKLGKEELGEVPMFKAKPLNRKVLESKGDLGIFFRTKREVTIPKEFRFATDDRIPPPVTVSDLFEKERALEKEKKFVSETREKELAEERARVGKAKPSPCTTDYPMIPPKPKPEDCTNPEPFQLESLVRHEEGIQGEREERLRIDKEKAQLRAFEARLIVKENPFPVPEKVRKPMTEVQEFNLSPDNRAVDREEFDKNVLPSPPHYVIEIKEKETTYTRYIDKAESARMVREASFCFMGCRREGLEAMPDHCPTILYATKVCGRTFTVAYELT